MDKLFNFKLSNQKALSKQCIEKQLLTFNDVCNHVKHLPYGRNSNRSNYSVIIKEHKGTCSTKHAFLSQIAIENSIQEVVLCIGIYRMTDKNTKSVGSILKQYNLDFIPEAHTYLKIDGVTFDFTSPKSNQLKFKDSLMIEDKIIPSQIGDYKIKLHQDFLMNWIEKDRIPYSFEDIWSIREACIKIEPIKNPKVKPSGS